MEQLGKEDKLGRARLFISSPENRDKNAVSLLLEVSARVGENVAFHCSEEHCLSLNKLFTCEVKFGSLLGPCKAIGASKKMAKSSAAEQALEMLKANGESAKSTTFSPRQQSRHSLIVTRTSEAAHGSSSLRSPGDWGPTSPQSGNNPIGQLQELVTERRWTPPIYSAEAEHGQDHDKTFIVECKIDELLSQGKGRSKKTAKKVSAENMLSLIEETERVSKRGNNMDDAASPPFIPLRARTPEFEPLPKSPRSTISPGASASRPSFFESFLYDSSTLHERDGIDLRELKSPLSFDQNQPPNQTNKFCETLKERGSTDDFGIEYHDLPDNGYSGNHLCFVELRTSPRAVCCGSGVTVRVAHAEAANNALQYLDVVSAKN